MGVWYVVWCVLWLSLVTKYTGYFVYNLQCGSWLVIKYTWYIYGVFSTYSENMVCLVYMAWHVAQSGGWVSLLARGSSLVANFLLVACVGTLAHADNDPDDNCADLDDDHTLFWVVAYCSTGPEEGRQKCRFCWDVGALWGGAPLQRMGEHWDQMDCRLQGAKRCDNGCTK